MQFCTDVLIIGAGPSGLMSALSLASQGVSVIILEKNESRPARGRADGFEPRTLEILESFGLLEGWFRHANHTVEFCLWVCVIAWMPPAALPSNVPITKCTDIVQASSHGKTLARIMTKCNSSQGVSRFYESTMDQAVLQHAIEDLLNKKYGVSVHYGVECTRMGHPDNIHDASTNLITVSVNCSGQPCSYAARYVIGADGASSWTRKCVGVRMQGTHSRRCRARWGQWKRR